VSRGIYIPSYPIPAVGVGIQPGFRAGGFGAGGGGGAPAFSFPQYAGFDDFTEGQYPTAVAPILSYIESGKVLTRAIGYGATTAPNYPVEVTYAQAKQLHRDQAPGSCGVEFDLGDLAINPSTHTDILRMEFFGSMDYGNRGYYYMNLTDTPWGGGPTQNMVQYYWTFASAGSWGRIRTTTGGVQVEDGSLGNDGWQYSYGIPKGYEQVWQVEFDFPRDYYHVEYWGCINTNTGRTKGALNTKSYSGPANLNASLRYVQLFAYGDGTGSRAMQCIHAWVGTGEHAFPDGVKQ
jgi:hypothetical protein